MKETTQGRVRPSLLIPLVVPLLPAFYGFFQIINNDIGFHIATGRAIDRLGTVPTTNVLSFAQPEQPWILHQWIPAWLFHRLEQGLGPGSLVFIKCLIIYVTFLLTWLTLTAGRNRTGPAAVFFALAAAAASSRFYVRPFIFSMLGLALMLYLLARYEQRPSRPLTLAIPLTAGLFAALHAGIIYSLLVVAAFAAAACLAGRCRGRQAFTPLLLLLAAVGLAGLAAVLESPWGLTALTLPFRFSTNEYFHRHLAEFRPLPWSLSSYPFAWSLMGLSLALLAWAGWRERKKILSRPFLFEALCLLGFTALVLKHLRIVYPCALVAAVVGTRLASRLLPSSPNRRRTTALMVVCALAIGAAGGVRQFTYARPGPGIDHRFYPANAFAFVDRHQLPGPTYVSDAWGGHWLWRYYPSRRVFYDNRLEAYSFAFFRETYQSIRYGEPGWQDKLDDYNINLLLMKYTTGTERSFQKGKPNLRELALRSPRWRLVYWDDLGEIFVRAGPDFAACRTCDTFTAFNPDTMEPMPGAAPGAVARDLTVAWERFPSGRSCYALSSLLIMNNDRRGAAAVLKEGLNKFPQHPLLLSLANKLE